MKGRFYDSLAIEEKNRYLKGFKWRGSEQPKTKEDIFIE